MVRLVLLDIEVALLVCLISVCGCITLVLCFGVCYPVMLCMFVVWCTGYCCEVYIVEVYGLKFSYVEVVNVTSDCSFGLSLLGLEKL